MQNPEDPVRSEKPGLLLLDEAGQLGGWKGSVAVTCNCCAQVLDVMPRPVLREMDRI